MLSFIKGYKDGVRYMNTKVLENGAHNLKLYIEDRVYSIGFKIGAYKVQSMFNGRTLKDLIHNGYPTKIINEPYLRFLYQLWNTVDGKKTKYGRL